MNEILNLLMPLSRDIQVIMAYIVALKKSKLDDFKDTWLDGQDVMQTMHISKRTLQSLRDNGTLAYSRINGKFYYKMADIQYLLESNYSHSKSTGNGNK